MIRLRTEVNELAPEHFREFFVLILRIDQDDIVLILEEHLQHLQLCCEPFAAAGFSKDESMRIRQKLPVSDQDIFTDLVDSVEQSVRIIQLMYSKRCKCGKRLGEQRIHVCRKPCARRKRRVQCLQLVLACRTEPEAFPFRCRHKGRHTALQSTEAVRRYYRI